jgi:hypothetical protein
MNTHGHHGIEALCGTMPRRLNHSDISLLKPGTRVHVTWDGGNGPHLYKIVEDHTHQHDMWAEHNRTRVCPTRVVDLLDDYSCYVSLAESLV